jgi:voltage-gated potassium channel
MRKLAVALLSMVIVIAVGMVGFMLIEHMNSMDDLYMTVITFSTVGFGEVVPLHPEGKIFVIFLILFGAVLAGYTVSVIGQMVLEGHFYEMFGRKKIENRIKKLSDHYIIAGFGRVGHQVAREFARRKVDFVVIEKEPAGIEELLADGYLTVEGEATVDDVLRRAGIKRAHTLVSTLPDEAQNVYLTFPVTFAVLLRYITST